MDGDHRCAMAFAVSPQRHDSIERYGECKFIGVGCRHVFGDNKCSGSGSSEFPGFRSCQPYIIVSSTPTSSVKRSGDYISDTRIDACGIKGNFCLDGEWCYSEEVAAVFRFYSWRERY